MSVSNQMYELKKSPPGPANAQTDINGTQSLPRKEGAQSIHRAMAILRAVAKFHDHGVRLSNISRVLGLHVTTVRRILSALAEEGFVFYDSLSKLYHLGFEFYSIASQTAYSSLRNTFRMTLERVAEKSEDNVYLIVRSEYDTHCLDRVEGTCAIQILFSVGMRLPLGIGASGIALLAFLPDKEVDRILSANHLRYREYHNMPLEKLRKSIAIARDLGYALDRNTFFEGVTGVAVPIRNTKGVPEASITVASVTERMPPHRCEEIAEIIRHEIALVKPT